MITDKYMDVYLYNSHPFIFNRKNEAPYLSFVSYKFQNS
jgi:hypothetical protein